MSVLIYKVKLIDKASVEDRHSGRFFGTKVFVLQLCTTTSTMMYT